MVVMISQPLGGKSNEEIQRTRAKAIQKLQSYGYTVLNTNILSSPSDSPLYYLGTSLQYMSKCDAVYFCKGWDSARSCRIEHEAASAYGLQIIYDGDFLS